MAVSFFQKILSLNMQPILYANLVAKKNKKTFTLVGKKFRQVRKIVDW